MLFDVNILTEGFRSVIPRQEVDLFLSFHWSIFILHSFGWFVCGEKMSKSREWNNKLFGQSSRDTQRNMKASSGRFFFHRSENARRRITPGQQAYSVKLIFQLRAPKPSSTNTKSINSSVLMLHKWFLKHTHTHAKTYGTQKQQHHRSRTIVCWCFPLIRHQNIAK